MSIYAAPGSFRELSVRCMRQRFSWKRSALKYIRLYQKLISESVVAARRIQGEK